MASNYPASLDSFDTIASDKKTSDVVGGRTHRQMHNDLGDAIEAVQAELGTDPAGTFSTVKARFEAIEGSTLPQIDAKGDLIVGTADNTYDNLSVGTNDTVLVADSGQAKGVKWAQVPTEGIADSAVTSAKIANGTIVAADIANDTITAAKLVTSDVEDLVEASPTGVRAAGAVSRGVSPDWTLGVDATSLLGGTGLTVVDGKIEATSGGTTGNWSLPAWHKSSPRASARVTVTKSTSSSVSYVGGCPGTPGTVPTPGASYCFAGGYLQGTGICLIRDGIGSPTVLVADAALTDGDQYDITVTWDRDLHKRYTSNTSGVISVRAQKVGETTVHQADTTYDQYFVPANLVVRTNVADGVLENVALGPTSTSTLPATAPPGYLVANYEPTANTETTAVFIPQRTNGLAVIALHGHGGNLSTDANLVSTWRALNDAGYLVACPYLGGETWGNNAAQAFLAELQSVLVEEFGVDPWMHLYGDSMGAGAALTAIAKGTIPVRSAYLAEAVCDLAEIWVDENYTSILTAYSSDTTLRDANDPMQFDAADFAGVPMLFVASASDTAVPKADHTDAMRTKLGSSVPNYLITATGDHTDASHYNANATLQFFQANP